jgi:hypothetical protein
MFRYLRVNVLGVWAAVICRTQARDLLRRRGSRFVASAALSGEQAPRRLCEDPRGLLFESVSLILLPSRCPEATHTPQVESQANELELSLHAVQSS